MRDKGHATIHGHLSGVALRDIALFAKMRIQIDTSAKKHTQILGVCGFMTAKSSLSIELPMGFTICDSRSTNPLTYATPSHLVY